MTKPIATERQKACTGWLAVMRAGASKARGADAGFTLLELMASLAILSIAVALVLPRIGAGGDQIALRSAAMQLAAGLRATRREAMAASSEAALVVDLDQRRYWADGAVKARTLPTVIVITAGNSRGRPVAMNRASIRFQPDGSSSGGWIGLRSKSHAASITVDWLTGAVDIEWAR